jgi:hypothetical protein
MPLYFRDFSVKYCKYEDAVISVVVEAFHPLPDTNFRLRYWPHLTTRNRRCVALTGVNTLMLDVMTGGAAVAGFIVGLRFLGRLSDSLDVVSSGAIKSA